MDTMDQRVLYWQDSLAIQFNNTNDLRSNTKKLQKLYNFYTNKHLNNVERDKPVKNPLGQKKPGTYFSIECSVSSFED